MKKILTPLIISLSLSGCSVFMPVTIPEIHKYQINGVANNNLTTCTKTSAGILQVSQMKADAPFDTTRMFYSNAEYELSSYAYHQWISTPNVMLTQAIQEKLLQSCIYANVVNEDFMTSSQHRLNTQLLELKQVMPKGADKQTTIHMLILAQLVDNQTNQVIKSKTFVEEISAESSPTAYVAASNQVTQMFLNDLVTWLQE